MTNSDLKLGDDVRALLESELGSEVPNPNSAEFQSFLEDIQASRPDLFDEVMRGLHVNVVMPVEAQAQQAERRDNVQATVQRAFFRSSQIDGEPVTAKRRLMMYVLGSLAMLLPISYILGQVLPLGAAEIETPIEAPAIEAQLPEPASTPLTALPPEPEPDPPTPPVVETPLPKLPPPPREVLTEPAPAPPKSTPAAPTASSLAPPPAAPAEPILPTTLSSFKAEEALPATLGVPVAPTVSQAPPELNIYEQDKVLPDSLEIAAAAAAPDALTITETSATSQADETVIYDIDQIETGSAAPDSLELPSSLSADDPVTQAAAPPKLMSVGSRVAATLITGVTVTQGSSVPIVAETTSRWCSEETCPPITWIGQATLDASERVQVTLTQAVIDSSLQAVTGLALNPDFSVGLTAEIRYDSPSSAEQLVRAGLGGVSDYVEALNQQQKVSIVDGVAVAETQTPSVDNFILGRVTSLFDFQQGDAKSIRVAHIPANTPIVLLYGVDN